VPRKRRNLSDAGGRMPDEPHRGRQSRQERAHNVDVSPRTRQILAAITNELNAAYSPLPLPTLLTRLKQQMPLVPAEIISAEITTAASAGLLHIVDGAVSLPPSGPALVSADADPDATIPEVDRPLRAVAVDVESVVRLNPDAPEYRDARIWQIGAVRISADTAWATGAAFNTYVSLPSDEWRAELRSPKVRSRVESKGIGTAEALERLRDFCSDADVLVAYNGIGVDFPLLDAASDRVGLPHPSGVRVDAYYLALATWPFPKRSHRLAELAEDVGVDRTGLSWHDAADDAELTARLLRAASKTHQGLPAPMREMLDAVTHRSVAWRLIRELGTGSSLPTPDALDDTETANALTAAIGHLPLRRDPSGGALPGTGALTLPVMLKKDGRTSPHQLAQVVSPGNVTPRPAQNQMAELLTKWLPDTDGAIEAPTGTGKSLAVLAVALDHLAADPNHRVVIATHTRQLQAQLARDVHRLGGAVPGLLDLTDVVKGATNRLSLRSLVTALADTSQAATADTPPRRRGVRTGYADQSAYGELLATIVLRLHHAHTPLEQWAARSVDSADLPVFLSEYLPGRFGAYLNTISQSHGEYSSAAGLAELTDTVEDALGGHRLVLANHALLLSHLDDFGTTGPDTLLIVDEAHTLESAATDALTPTVELRELESCLHTASSWLASHPTGGAEHARVVDCLEALRMHCAAEQLPQAISKLLDLRSSSPLGSTGPGRVVTLASPFGADHGEDRARAVTHLLGQTAIVVGELATALWAYLGTETGRRLDWYAQERTKMLALRLSTIESSARTIVEHSRRLLGDVTPTVVTGGRVTATTPAIAAEPASATAGAVANTRDNEAGDGDVEATIDPTELDAEDLEAGDVVANEDHEAETTASIADDDSDDDPARHVASQLLELGNQVVYVVEESADDPAASWREYAAAVQSSPVELQIDHEWLQFRSVFGRTFLTSATLTVSGGWEYLKRRLGLHDLKTATLTTPFDLAKQARLVAFSDYPSWAEHSKAAVATTVHQLTGYAREITHPDPGRAVDATTGQVTLVGGVLVLTTARKSAAAIAGQLAHSLAADAAATGRTPVPVHAAGLLGNRRAAEYLSSRGGITIGTKGLWAGVDIQPAERLKLVWINKLPFASADDPIVAARRAAIAAAAAETGADDPDLVATETYYLPLAAVDLRQAVGRLVRSDDHTGVIVISDRKLAGDTRQRRTYRRIFLESLEPGLHLTDPTTAEPCGGNVVTMADGWKLIWEFLASHGALTADRAAELSSDEALDEHTVLPQTRKIRQLALTREQHAQLRDADASLDTLAEAIVTRSAEVGGLLNLSDTPLVLKDQQKTVIDAAARGHDVLAVLPTGFGKSYTFQLPALVSPGVTLVISPLVALMTDQALELNRTIGGAVRALVAPMTESVSRLGKTEVADQLTGARDHGIKLVYLSPERLCQRRMQEVVEQAVRDGIITRIAIDEAHTFVQWGDDFRPSFRRLEQYLRRLRRDHGLPLTAVTATATRSVLDGLRSGLFGLAALPPGDAESDVPAGRADTDPNTFAYAAANPLRTTLALYKRTFPAGAGGPVALAGLVERIVDSLDGHTILYCLTVREVDALAAALRAYVGDTGSARVLRFHSRLSEAEKQSVAFSFREAPAADEDGYTPMIVVATSAFGLGVNRADIRCVAAVSPPTDLAALYQQLGRAGRDGDPATGITLATGRSLRTVAFFADLGLSAATMQRIGTRLMRIAVAASGGTFGLDVDRLATDSLVDDVTSGAVSATQARRAGTAESYRTGVMRAVAALSAEGTLDDRGDHPISVAVLAGERVPDDPDTARLVAGALRVAATGTRGVIRIAEAHSVLSSDADWAALADDPGATWNLLAAMHDRGWLDVSQAPCRGRTHTCLAVPAGTQPVLPGGYIRRVSAHRARARAELAALRGFLASPGCLNAGFASYLATSDPGVCAAGPTCRCSACWGVVGGPKERRPALLEAVLTPRPRPQIARDAPHRLARLDEQVRTLLWDVRGGLTAGMMALVLKGGESYYSLRSGTRRPLWPQLLYHRLRGADPALKVDDVTTSLDRLAANNVAVDTGNGLWRLQRHLDVEAARTARAAVRAAAAAAAGAPAGGTS
jgi:superfamily II DNA helicase RecQ/Rad3-related DNA helicase